MRRRSGRLKDAEDLPVELRPGEWGRWLEEGESADDAWHRYQAMRRQRAAARTWCGENGVGYHGDFLRLLHPEWFGLPRGGPVCATRAEVAAYRRRAGLSPLPRDR